jgi:hypothetical protein
MMRCVDGGHARRVFPSFHAPRQGCAEKQVAWGVSPVGGALSSRDYRRVFCSGGGIQARIQAGKIAPSKQQRGAKLDCVEAAQRVTLDEAFRREQAFGGDFNDVKPVPFAQEPPETGRSGGQPELRSF